MPGRLKSPLFIAFINGIVGALFLLTPWASRLEENFGLEWLFQARGSQPPPEQVVLVVMDTESMNRLGLERLHRKWPRQLHAQLIQKLSAADAAVITFDIFFREPREPAGDQALADAIRQAGNVILFRYLHKDAVQLQADGRSATVFVEKIVDPIPIFADAAVALAPFALPGVPVKVSQFWKFKPEIGGLATLPAMAFQYYSLDLYNALQKMVPPEDGLLPATSAEMLQSPGLESYMQQMRSRLMGQGVADWLQADTGADDPLLKSLLSMYSGGHSQFLNYYGPPRTINSVPYYRVLSMSDAEMQMLFAGRAVFVGVSEAFQWDQKDTFYTVYSDRQTGHNISGVEIAATAFGNLLQRTWIKPLGDGYAFVLILLWGGLIGLVCRWLSAGRAIVTLFVLCAGYAAAALGSFSAASIWLPVVVPLFVQVLPVLFFTMLLGYQEAHEERVKIALALGRYLPPQAVEDLAKSVQRTGGAGETVYGVCLATDAEQYTRLSEQMEPAELRLFLNAYYEIVFQAIHEQGGIISDVVGDAVLALWVSPEPQAERRIKACHAALNVMSAVEQFNRQQPEYRLPTRIGLHYGEICIGDVGAGEHYEYRAIGDVVNTATRIEGANKHFGTRLLISSEGLAGINNIVTRELGLFRLAGKSRAIHLFELLGHSQSCPEATTRLLAGYEQAFSAFKRQKWEEASGYFAKIVQEYPEDGPSLFYLDLSNRYRRSPPGEEWEGVITLKRK